MITGFVSSTVMFALNHTIIFIYVLYHNKLTRTSVHQTHGVWQDIADYAGA